MKLAKGFHRRQNGQDVLYFWTSRRPAFILRTSASCSIVLQRLVDAGNTVLVIEHNLDVIKGCRPLIDMGPGAVTAAEPSWFRAHRSRLRTVRRVIRVKLFAPLPQARPGASGST